MTESSIMQDATVTEKQLELMDIDSAIGSDMEIDTEYDGVSEVDNESDLGNDTMIRMEVLEDEDHSQHTGETSIKPSKGFTAIFSAAQQDELRLLLDEDGPHRAVWEKITKSKPSSEYFQLTKGDDSHFVEKQKEDLASLARTVPPHQFRAYSLGGVARSGGFSSPSVFLCNSSRNHIKRYRKLDNMTINDAATMLTAHTCWIGRKEDEFLSWTSSFFLALTIAMLRHEKGQKHVHIAWGDIRKLQAPDGEQATFYPVVELQMFLPPGHILDLTERTMCKLRPRHFTQEAVSVGDMLDPEKAVGHALLEDLVKNGLLQLLPELVIDDYFLERNGMYNHCIWMKYKLFRYVPPAVITEHELALCIGLASCFKQDKNSAVDFWCVITLLSLRLRPKRNPVLQDWVRQHITERDIKEGTYEQMDKVADNLPDVKQRMLLAWEAAEALELKPNPVPEVEIYKWATLDRFAMDEINLKPPQEKDEYDPLSWHLVDEDIYGPDEESLQARRDLAECDEKLSALLKLARLSEKVEKSTGVLTGPSEANVPLSDSAIAESAFAGPPTRRVRQPLAEAIANIMEAEKRAEEERRKREEKKTLERERKATNRQNREELCRKLGIPTPSEERRRKKAEKKKDAEDDKPKYFLYAKAGEKCKAEDDSTAEKDPEADNDVEVVHEPEMVTAKRQRREKSTEEQRADFLAALERISGRLQRREASRSTMADLHEEWKTKRVHVLGGSSEQSTAEASPICQLSEAVPKI